MEQINTQYKEAVKAISSRFFSKKYPQYAYFL